MIRRLLLPIAAGACLTACATSYQSMGMTGGHLEQKGPGALEMVAFSANGYTKPELAQKYALYRCAELAQLKHKPFFMMYSSLLAAARNDAAETPRVGSVQGKPTATAFILMLDGPKPGAHNTADVLSDLKQVIETGSLEKI